MRTRFTPDDSDEFEGSIDEALAPLAAGRQRRIIEFVREEGAIRVRALALRLQVSDMTIRRDIDALASRGLLEKIHGGAKLPEGLSKDEPRFDRKRLRNGSEKAAIARAALELVVPGMVVGVSAGSTTYAFAQLLRDVEGVTVVTNSLPVADKLAQGKRNLHVLLTGGERTRSDALVGPLAVSTLRQLHVDTLFLGVHGVHERAGLTSPNLQESELDQVFISAAGRVVLLADHTKWGVIGMSTIAPLGAVDVLISDSGLSQVAREHLEQSVGRLTIAGEDPAQSAAAGA